MFRLLKCGKCSPKKALRLLSSNSVKAPEGPDCLVRFGALRPSPYEHGHHRSNAEELVNKVPVIMVDGFEAVCDGGGGALGHPIEYIQLNKVFSKPAICKYCGLRFQSTHGHH